MLQKLDDLGERLHQQFVAGKWKAPLSSIHMPLESPMTKESFAWVPEATPEEIREALASNAAAQALWNEVPLKARIEKLRTVLSNLKGMRSAFVDALLHEIGAPIVYSKEKLVDATLKRFEHWLAAAERFDAYVSANVEISPDPLGVAAVFPHWSEPFEQIVNAAVPALLAGNAVLLLPNPRAPISAFLFACAAEQALPPGVLNLVSAPEDAIEIVVRSPEVALTCFFGELNRGRRIVSMEPTKRFSLELIGSTPCLWLESLPSRHYKAAASAVIESAFLHSGQRSSSISRLFLPSKQSEEIVACLVEALRRYPCGNPGNRSSKIGPVANARQFERISDLIRVTEEEGAAIAAGGKPKPPLGGYYMRPTIFADVAQTMRVARSPVFGPVLACISYDDASQVDAQINRTFSGKRAYVIGEGSEAREAARFINAGEVLISQFDKDDRAKAQRVAAMSDLTAELFEFTKKKRIRSFPAA